MCILKQMILNDEIQNTCCIFMLHSKFSKVDGNEVFKEPPKGKRKLVISTNICESSITIDDVEHVINSGYTKVARYSHIYKLDELICKRSSDMSNIQRAGRAGRQKPGYCYQMFSPDTQIVESEKPDLVTSSLIRLSLFIKVLDLGCIRSFFGKAVQPPKSETISYAISDLVKKKLWTGKKI